MFPRGSVEFHCPLHVLGLVNRHPWTSPRVNRVMDSMEKSSQKSAVSLLPYTGHLTYFLYAIQAGL